MKSTLVLIKTLLAPLFIASFISPAQAAVPVANAGPDITVADFNNDGSVTMKLNGGASTDADGDIVSYAWTWPGGSASGQTPEAVFPASNAPVTVTLTVTDATSGTSVDTLTVAAFTKQAGLFTDFKKPVYSGTDFSNSVYGTRVVGSLRGDTLVIDPKGSGVPEIYRYSAGNWTPSTFTASVSDIRAIDVNTLLSGNIASGNGFTAHRLVAGNWIASTQSVSATPPGQRIQDNAYEAQAVASSNSFDDTYFNNAGRAFVYDWTGDTWTHTELLPPEGFVASKRWGEGIDTDGTTTAITDGSGSTVIPNLKIFKKTGTWTHQVSLAPPIEPGGYGQSYFSGIVAVGNGVVVAQRVFPYTLFVIEFNGSSWVQTPLTIPPAVPYGGYYGLKMNDDGQAFVAYDQTGHIFLYQKDALSSNWATATVTQRQLPITGMFGGNQLLCTEFSGGKIVISDSINGVVRVFDKNAPFDTINAEPIANAGADISTTSFDGQPVRLFLNGGLSSDASANETLTAAWTWNGGSISGLQTFAMIPASVTTITLTLTDSKGAISRDTLATTIKRPPVVNPGSNAVIADSDGDGLIHLKVNPTVISQNYPIVSWNWRWPGGTFSGRSGTLILGPDADGKEVTLEVIDSNGLSSVTSFTFDLLNPDPVPDIIEPVDGVSLDRFGWAVGVNDGVALTGAPFKTTNGTYFAENINDDWFQYSLASADRRGQAVLIDDGFAFVGAEFQGASSSNPGAVVIYKQQSGQWVVSQTLTASDPESGAFGASIARRGNTLLVGAPMTGVSNARTGAVYVFELSAGVWSRVQKIISPEPATFFGENFGAAIAISGNFLAVAQPGFATTSSVFVYEKGGSSWNLNTEFQADIPRSPQNRGPNNNGDFFGVGLAMNDTELLIGSPQDSQVFRYNRSASMWTRNGEINPGYYRFGKSLALHDGVLVVGAYLDEAGHFTDPDFVWGSVSTFALNGGNWQETGYLRTNKALDPLIGDQNIEQPEFGYSVAHDGKDLIVGVPWGRNSAGVQTGKTYIYRNYAPLNPNANYEPLANAGADINVSDTVARGPAPAYLITEPLGSELVTLNGTASTDRENALVSYEWTWPGGSATGATPTARFPVGTTTVTLTVMDGADIIHTDTVSVTVSLSQTTPVALPVTTGNTLTLNLPSLAAKWRLSSEFLWHGDGESASNVVDGETYQIEIIAFPGSTDVLTTFITMAGANTTEDLELELAEPSTTTGTISFPETAQGFSWRLTGESAWRNVTDNGDQNEDDIETVLPTGEYRIEFKPVTGFATPLSRTVTINVNGIVGIDWSDYLRIGNFDPARTFDLTPSPNLAGDPFRYIGMIRSPLGRGTGTVVAERVVLTAAHLFFDGNGLQWSDAQWFSRQQQGTRQAPPVAPRGVLYRTSYAKLVAPDSVEGTIADLPDDDQEVDFAVLYFSSETDWDQGSANFLQSTPQKNWLTGSENKRAVGYPQRSQPYENRGKIFAKAFTTVLSPLDANSPPRLYETSAVFGDGGASGSALFVQPLGGTNSYPAAILLAGQGRGVYHIIDEDVTRMIKDGEDAASGNDEVLDSNSSLLTFEGLGNFTTIAVNVNPAAARTNARWSIKPKTAAGISNMKITREILYDDERDNITITFTAVSGYASPAPLKILKSSLSPNATNTYTFTYTVLPPPPDPPTALQAWKDLHGINNLSADGDKDGMSNLLEYALNRNPGTSDYRPGIRNTANPTQNVYAEFDVFVSTSAEGITYKVKASNNLDRTNTTTLATFTSADGPSGYRKVTDTQPISTSTKRFAWLEVVAPDP